MKFLALALAALVGATEAKKMSAQQLKTRMSNGQFNKQTLMRGAKPYNTATRRIEQNADDAQEEFQINGLYSVEFSSCVSFTVEDEDMLAEDYINYAADGFLVAEKSYILFTACESQSCSNNSKMTFITDIATFFQSFADFLPNQVEQYCNGCQENYDYCSGNFDAYMDDAANNADADADADADNEAEGENAENQDAQDGEQNENAENQEDGEQNENADGEDNAGRKLQQQQVIQMIDCNMCEAYECFAQNEQNQDGQQRKLQGDDAANAGDDAIYEFEDALEWLDGLSQCQQMQQTFYENDLPLYGGLLCNENGNGIEIGVFMDQDCTLYAPKLSFGSMMTSADSEYFAMTEEVVEFMFTNDFSCYQPDVVYANPYTYDNYQQEAANQQNNGDNNNGENQDPEAADWCQSLWNGNMEVVDMYDCGANQNNEANEQGDDAAYDENLDTYEWYSYELSQEQAQDGTEVCEQIKGLNGKTPTVYDKQNSGTLYNYKKSWGQNGGNGISPGGAATIVFFVLVAAAVGAVLYSKKSKANEKKTPLISTNEGTMA